MGKKQSIKNRIITAYLVLVLVSFTLLGIALKVTIEGYYMERIQESLYAEALLVSGFIGEAALTRQGEYDDLIKSVSSALDTRITLIDREGHVLADSFEIPSNMDNHLSRPEVKTALQLGNTAVEKRYSATVDAELMYLAYPVKKGNEVLGVVRISMSLEQLQMSLNRIYSAVLVSIIIIASIAALLGIRLSRSITRPIEELTLTAEEISKGNLRKRAFGGAPDEIGRLAISLNEMTSALQEKINQLEESKGRLETILNHLSSGVIVLTAKGRLEMLNNTALHLLGVQEGLRQEELDALLLRRYAINQGITRAFEEKCLVKISWEVDVQEPRTLEVDIVPVQVRGQVISMILVLHDITELKKLERIKADFVANASHELRTPLTSIKGYAETLLHGAINDEKNRVRFVTIIDQEAERLIALTDSLLALERAERGQISQKKERLDINILLSELAEQFAPRLAEKKQILELPEDPGLPNVCANREAWTSILRNLIDNAIKYTQVEGRIGVIVERQGPWELKFTVWDTGPGIPETDLPRVFERFYRVEKSRSRSQGGTGLGLAIVKHLVEIQGGAIGVESQLGKGTRFWVILPIEVEKCS